MMGYYGDLGWWGWLWMLVMPVFWVGLLALVFWGVGNLFARPAGVLDRLTPLETAKARYARGEITKGEYEELAKDLR